MIMCACVHVHVCVEVERARITVTFRFHFIILFFKAESHYIALAGPEFTVILLFLPS